MNSKYCFYCEDGEKRKSLMIEIAKLQVSTLYLNRDQKHLGRCVLKFNEHKTDISFLNDDENRKFFEDLKKVASVLTDLYHPNKINYAIYGDLVPHLHVHIVPKYEGALQWGEPFNDGIPGKTLSDQEYQKIIEDIKEKLRKY